MSEADPLTSPGPDKQGTKNKIWLALWNTDKWALTKSELAEEADVSRRTIYNRLDDVIEDAGVIESRDLGQQVIYWIEETDIENVDLPAGYAEPEKSRRLITGATAMGVVPSVSLFTTHPLKWAGVAAILPVSVILWILSLPLPAALAWVGGFYVITGADWQNLKSRNFRPPEQRFLLSIPVGGMVISASVFVLARVTNNALVPAHDAGTDWTFGVYAICSLVVLAGLAYNLAMYGAAPSVRREVKA